jgi:mRNA interferase MazF
MKISQGDIIELPFPLPQDNLAHPAIVISNNDINHNEDVFIAVMLSTIKREDNYTFWIEENMLSIKPKNKSQVRLHLVCMFTENDVMGKFGKIKPTFLTKLLKK